MANFIPPASGASLGSYFYAKTSRWHQRAFNANGKHKYNVTYIFFMISYSWCARASTNACPQNVYGSIKQLIKQDMPKLNEHLSLIADETESEDDEEVHTDDD